MVAMGDDETITPAIVQTAFEENGHLVARIIAGLRIGKDLADDTRSTWLDGVEELDKKAQEMRVEGENAEAKTLPSAKDPVPAPPLVPPQKTKGPKVAARLVGYAADASIKKGLSSYSALKRDGWTKPAAEFAC